MQFDNGHITEFLSPCQGFVHIGIQAWEILKGFELYHILILQFVEQHEDYLPQCSHGFRTAIFQPQLSSLFLPRANSLLHFFVSNGFVLV